MQSRRSEDQHHCPFSMANYLFMFSFAFPHKDQYHVYFFKNKVNVEKYSFLILWLGKLLEMDEKRKEKQEMDPF